MPLRRKLLLAMMIPAVLLGAVGVIGITSLHHLEQAAGRILADNYRTIQETRRMEEALRAFLPRDDGRADPAAVPDPDRATARFDAALDRCESNITVPGETAALRSIRRRWELLRGSLAAGERLSPLALSARSVAVEELYGELEVLVNLNETAMEQYERETRRVARGMRAAFAGSCLAALVALAVFALVSARRIARPVVEAADRLHQALGRGGTASQGAAGRDQDEIRRLRRELDALIERLGRYEDEQNRKLSHLQGRLAFVMNEVQEGLILLDADRRVLTLNRVARALLGPGIAEGAQLDRDALRPEVADVLEPLLSGDHRPERDLDELRHGTGGEERVYRPRAMTVATANGEVEGHLLLFWDVTEQRRFEESRRRFISMLSHQLKTPMTSLSMSVHMLRERLQDAAPAQAELLAIATEDCGNLATLISDLIEAAKDVTPELTLKTRRVDVAHLLGAALRPLAPQAEDKGIELLLPESGKPVLADVDPVKFPWVVTNIAGNALRYTEAGGRVTVSVTRGDRAVTVTVADTGVGIPHEYLDRIFQPYWSPEQEPQPGTHGLGLAIAKEIMEAHGGSIEAESRPGQGTRFHLHLPTDGKTES